MIEMYLVYDNKKIKLVECKSFFSRLRGFMGVKEINLAIVFNRCNSIHTFFMKSNIDVIMCDKDNNILFYFNNLDKNKIIWPKKKVYRTIELPVNYFNIKINKKIRMEKE